MVTCDLARFALLVRESSKRIRIPEATRRDPRAAARTLIDARTGTLEAQVLAKLADAVDQRSGAFNESDVYALGGEALGIAGALVAVRAEA